MNVLFSMMHLDSQQFHIRIGSLLDRFKPNNEVFEAIRQKEKIQLNPEQCEDLDSITLLRQEPGTVISVKGASRNYIVRINDGTLDIWGNLKSNGLRGPLEGIVSFLETGSKESYDLEQGVMRKTYGFSMPLLRYDQTKPPEKSAIKPNAPWLDKYEHIYVWKRA